MKKGIVMEHHHNYSIIMTRDGSFQKAIVLREDAKIGEEVTYRPLNTVKHKKRISIRMFSLACIVLILVVPLYFLIGNKDTYAYVTVDINPSIEMEVDEELNVRTIRALNEDASRIIAQLSGYKNEKVEKVIGIIMRKSENTGLVNDDKNMIVGISYTENTTSKEPLNTSTLDSFFSKVSGWEVATLVVPEKVREQANDTEISMNEVMATEIMENDNPSSEINSIDQNDKEIINSFYNDDDEEEDTSTSVKKETLVITPVKTQDEEIRNQIKNNTGQKPSGNEYDDNKAGKSKEETVSDKNGNNGNSLKNKQNKPQQHKNNWNHTNNKQGHPNKKMNHPHGNRGNNQKAKDPSPNHKEKKFNHHQHHENHGEKKKDNRHKNKHNHGNGNNKNAQ